MKYFKIILTKQYCILFLIFISSTGESQKNLVPNPSFEAFTSCPDGISELSLASPWFTPNLSTPDLYHTCASQGSWVNIPGPHIVNYSHSYSHSGNGMAGIVISRNVDQAEWWFGIYREYLAVPLLKTLVKNQKYYVSFFVKLPDSTQYACNLSLWLGKDSIVKGGYDTITAIPQINNFSGTFITNKAQWTKIKGSFIANGTEKYVYIGNFKPSITNDTFFVGPGPRSPTKSNCFKPYYYVDDVCVSTDFIYSELWTGVENYRGEHVRNVFPNPTDGSMKVISGTLEKIISIELMNFQGKTVKQLSEINSEEYSLDITNLESGVYFIKIYLSDRSIFERLVKY